MQTSKRARPSDQKVLPYLTSAEDSILDAAERLFAKHGYDGVSNKQLAAEAGLTIGAIYHYFSSKDEVYAAAIRRRFANKAPLPTEIRESTEPAKRRLSRLITWFVASIGAIEKPPFYAVRIYPGDVGTAGGLVTDEDARVLRNDGSVIGGLYATGNCTASVMGKTYPGAGASIGASFVFGYRAALRAVGSKKE